VFNEKGDEQHERRGGLHRRFANTANRREGGQSYPDLLGNDGKTGGAGAGQLSSAEETKRGGKLMKRPMTWIEREIYYDKIRGYILHAAGVVMWFLMVAALLKYLWR
jgi:hypothetical protein